MSKLWVLVLFTCTLLLVYSIPLNQESVFVVGSPRNSLGVLDISDRKVSDKRLDSVSHPDCASQREKALTRRNQGDKRVYTPNCNPNNPMRYEKLQCYDITSLCWCVHEMTGEPIQGSTSQQSKPTCAEPATTTPVKRKNRCKGNKRKRFLRRLIATLKTEMIMTGINSTKISRDVAIKWKFAQLDRNKNKSLERTEWRPYKAILLEWKNTRHCSRNFFKTCDINSDKKVSSSEWGKCIVQEFTVVPAKRPEQLNPFLYILKSD